MFKIGQEYLHYLSEIRGRIVGRAERIIDHEIARHFRQKISWHVLAKRVTRDIHRRRLKVKCF